MLALALALVAAQTPQHRLFLQPNLPRSSFAFFEFAPLSGAGMPAACSTGTVSGAKGEVLTFARASSATCTKTASGGLATTGIADGDLVVLSSNVARVEYDSAGTLGLLVEAAGTNLLLRYIEYASAPWADVGTPTLTGSQVDPFGTTTAVLFDDNDGAAYEGRSQSITVSAGAAHLMHCLVKAGTLNRARILLDGTAATITGLSASTWSIIEVADASSSGTSISAQVMNGNATTDTGTVIWGGCDVKTGTYRTSIVPTAGTTVARAAEGGSVTITSTPILSMAGSVQFASNTLSNGRVIEAYTVAANDNDRFSLLISGVQPANFIANGGVSTTQASATNFTMPGLNRAAVWLASGATQNTIANGTANSAATARTTVTATTLYIGRYGGAVSNEPDGIITRLCADPDGARCR